ncbi:MAG: hypothetical protein GF364_09840 [Candidatus Lokiarchaeota archaeon]|nr:hypothetical protein [Candidatus Lokiarchaeota archaeon]
MKSKNKYCTLLVIIASFSIVIPVSDEYTSLDGIECSNEGGFYSGGSFILSDYGFDSGAIESVDIDLDGDYDIIAGRNNGSVYIFKNPGDSWENWEYYEIGDGGWDIEQIRTGDLDKDGDYDIVTSDYNGRIYLWENNGSIWVNNWTDRYEQIYDSSGKYVLELADMDGDGYLDIIAGGFTLGIEILDNDKTPFEGSWSAVEILTGYGYYAIGLDDVDEDGDLDIAASQSNSDNIYIFENEGKPWSSWSGNKIGDAGDDGDSESVHSYYFIDMDDDTDLDLLTGCNNYNLTWWENDGTPHSGTWTSHWLGDSDGQIKGIDMLDFDLDGELEIITHDSYESIYVWDYNGGNYDKIYIGEKYSYRSPVDVVDLDDDDDLDIVTMGYTNGLRSWKNVLPAFKNGYVTPDYGNSDTLFTFNVEYESYENIEVDITLEINGKEYLMSKTNPSDNNYLDGVDYTFSLNGLEQGIAEYMFSAESTDGIGAIGDNKTHYGPIIYSGSQTPDDTDGDGIANSNDDFPNNPNEWNDNDGDGIGDNTDTDDDGDGYLDSTDDFPFDNTEWNDNDNDGIGDNEDTDDDNDGILDSDDNYPFDSQNSIADNLNTIMIIAFGCVGILSFAIIINSVLNFVTTRRQFNASFRKDVPEELPDRKGK